MGRELLKVPVIDHWWQTETGWAIAGNPMGLGMLPVKHGSPTVAMPGYDVRIVDEAVPASLPAGTMGSIVVKLPLPPSCLPTLWQQDERFRESYLAEFPGYYKTADAGFKDEDGYLFIMGRTDDIINVAGHRLSTGGMEEVLAGHQDVAECAVIGIADALKGEVPCGFIVLKAGVNARRRRDREGDRRAGAREDRAGRGVQAGHHGGAAAEDALGQDPARHDEEDRRRRSLDHAGDDRGPEGARGDRRRAEGEGDRSVAVARCANARPARAGIAALATVPRISLRFIRATKKRKGNSNTQSEANSPKPTAKSKWEGCHAHRSILRRLAWAILPELVPALAQEKYPNRPVKFVVSFAAGGSNDIIARVLCEWLSEHFGQQFIVENRPGGSGNVGAASVLNSPPDGYTVMFVGPNNAISASVFKKLPFDFMRDTAPVGGIMTLINIMVVPTSLPVNTVAEFIAYAKANPGKINMASPGAGTSPHMSGELFKMMAGIEMQHIPYRGAGPAYPDLMTGKTQVFFDNLPGSVEFVKTGQLSALGVTSAKRSFVFPDVPSIGETIPGYDVTLYYGVSAPKGTPPDIVAILNKAINAALADPKMKERIAGFGGVPLAVTPADSASSSPTRR